MQGARVQSLVREIRSHMPCSVAKKLKKKKSKNLGHTINWMCYQDIRHKLGQPLSKLSNLHLSSCFSPTCEASSPPAHLLTLHQSVNI